MLLLTIKEITGRYFSLVNYSRRLYDHFCLALLRYYHNQSILNYRNKAKKIVVSIPTIREMEQFSEQITQYRSRLYYLNVHTAF